MRLIPFRVEEDRYNVFAVLEDANIERMKSYDPAQFDVRKLPPEFQAMKLGIVIIGYATKHDVETVEKLITDGYPAAALEFLSRGFQYQPQKGDTDRPYESPL